MSVDVRLRSKLPSVGTTMPTCCERGRLSTSWPAELYVEQTAAEKYGTRS